MKKMEAARAETQKHKKEEHLGEVGALAAGAFAMYEAHKSKTDTEHAGRHKIEAEVAGTAAVGAAGFAVYEHFEKKKTEHVYEEAGGEKKHHHFF